MRKKNLLIRYFVTVYLFDVVNQFISLIGQSFDLFLTIEEGEREMKGKMEREW